jgi:hypothetical protein
MRVNVAEVARANKGPVPHADRGDAAHREGLRTSNSQRTALE